MKTKHQNNPTSPATSSLPRRGDAINLRVGSANNEPVPAYRVTGLPDWAEYALAKHSTAYRPTPHWVVVEVKTGKFFATGSTMREALDQARTTLASTNREHFLHLVAQCPVIN